MKLLMAANWKMYKTLAEAQRTLQELSAAIPAVPADRECAIFAPFTALSACSEVLPRGFLLGGQNCYPQLEGAYTGEISVAMLKDCGCSFVLAGHSERRSIFGESDKLVGEKTAFALQNGLRVILCVGETLAEREDGQLQGVIERQLRIGLDGVESVQAEDISIAYEPVWAIGTGRVAGPEEILEAHTFVRACLIKRFPLIGAEIRILYGGSVKADNVKSIIGLDNVNGVLVGGASLHAESFSKIALA